jgi:hypothetical protein
MSDRFWVNDSGTWSDAENHWSDSSGGTANSSYLPTDSDDVYFDAQSFGMTEQTVTIDDDASVCNSMDWSETLYNPTLAFDDTSSEAAIIIRQSLILTQNMIVTSTATTVNRCYISMGWTTDGTYTIDTKGIHLPILLEIWASTGPEIKIIYNLSSDLDVAIFTLASESLIFNTNDYQIDINSYFEMDSGTFYAGSSIININSTGHDDPVNDTIFALTNNYGSIYFNANTSTINFTTSGKIMILNEESHILHNVNISGRIDSFYILSDSLHIDKLTIEKGVHVLWNKMLQVGEGFYYFVEPYIRFLEVNGTSDNHAIFGSYSEGDQWAISVGSCSVNYLDLQDSFGKRNIDALFDNCGTDLGNNNGWRFGCIFSEGDSKVPDKPKMQGVIQSKSESGVKTYIPTVEKVISTGGTVGLPD